MRTLINWVLAIFIVALCVGVYNFERPAIIPVSEIYPDNSGNLIVNSFDNYMATGQPFPVFIVGDVNRVVVRVPVNLWGISKNRIYPIITILVPSQKVKNDLEARLAKEKYLDFRNY